MKQKFVQYGDKPKVGDKIRFAGERQAYTVQAADGRFVVCTKPFNLKASLTRKGKRMVMYSIVDMKEKVRGTENLIFCFGFETKKQCQDALERLASGETEVSHRNRVPLELA